MDTAKKVTFNLSADVTVKTRAFLNVTIDSTGDSDEDKRRAVAIARASSDWETPEFETDVDTIEVDDVSEED
jgi:hypothetical protein